ncbi:topoisomerase DNA-binding C4 zinc finger domain-containing protein [Photobacterium damselae subsp. piscicida]|nr:topoisomerase DNA-binding C4 zinc finger domain-containing protein [Photobacterium damselae subsp. piscicida]MDP2531802.1 topoisomerase DNA-binding C4 zinc finger domain-containing protein [Photobacterium damselae subsp. piscicida]MDP2545911.1 topoisomerase DNA-binding C4 zinc finger domain-containing protein [Photobacterium damselae subsp. piscicida]MDP2557147.1 topoisomerase DNA-binding C4 zinc finger domain-containing protein [Photobacterium damselae subsp. piscicida]MDP2570397.1 topoisom
MSHSSLFSNHEHALTQTCPQCGEPLQMRFGKHGPFLGCSHYPECDYIQPLKQNDGHIVKLLGVPCPKCQQELVLRQGRFGMFIGCSSYPQCDYISSPEKPAEKTHIACPECKTGHLVERKSRYGKLFYACNQYPRCRFAVNNKPVIGECQSCHYPLLIEKKLAAGVKLQCANRHCQAYQDSTDIK